MSWAFLAVVLAVIVVPGVDVVITLRNTIAAGRGAGAAAVLGIGAASVIQGALVSVGLGALIVRSQPVFLALKWLGIGYLLLLAGQALWSAWRGRYRDDADPLVARAEAGLGEDGHVGAESSIGVRYAPRIGLHAPFVRRIALGHHPDTLTREAAGACHAAPASLRIALRATLPAT